MRKSSVQTTPSNKRGSVHEVNNPDGDDTKEKDAVEEKATSRRREKVISPAMCEAMTHVKEFMTDNQKALTFLKIAKQVMDRQQDFFGALELLDEAIHLNPTASSFTTKAHAHKCLTKWSEAYYDYSFAIRLEPDNGSYYCSRGLCLAKMLRWDIAIEDLETAITLDPHPFHHYTKATVLADCLKDSLAITEYDKMLNLENVNTDLRLRAMYRRALCYFNVHQYDKCVKDLRKLLQSDPNGVNPRSLLGRALKMLGDLKGAEEALSHVLSLEENVASHFVERGDIRFRTSQKMKVIDANYDLNRAVDMLEGEHFRMVENLAKYAEEERAYHEMMNPTTQKSKGMANSLREAVDTASVNSSEHMSSVRDNDGDDDEESLKFSQDEDGDNGGFDEENEDGDELGDMLKTESAKMHTDSGDQNDSSTREMSRKQSKINIHKMPSRPDQNDLKELEHKMADAYFRRHQCSVFLHNSSREEYMLLRALDDARMATNYVPEDDDYQMAVATCYIKLRKFDDALDTFRTVLKRSPKNEKALYQFAFCQRAAGSTKDAIDSLTQIIATSQIAHDNALAGKAPGAYRAQVPLERVYGTRGTLFHEMHVHTLALHDLGRAIALNPERPENLYLRADCNAKLGNYEQALQDYNMAEDKDFSDKLSLYTSRGMILRMLGQSHFARADFERALTLLEKLERSNPTGNIVKDNEDGTQGYDLYTAKQDAAMLQLRLTALRAMCFIDMAMYNAGHTILVNVIGLVKEMENSLLEGNTVVDAILGLEAKIQEEEDAAKAIHEEEKRKMKEAEAAEKGDLAKPAAESKDSNTSDNKEKGGKVEEEDPAQEELRKKAEAEAIAKEQERIAKEEQEAYERQFSIPGTDKFALLNIDGRADKPDSMAGTGLISPNKSKKNVTLDLAADEGSRKKEIDKPMLQHIRRMKWVLLYHGALALHMQKRFEEAEEVLRQCVHETMMACAPDDITLGMVYFFLGVEFAQTQRLQEADESFANSLQSKWGSIDKNNTLINFAKAKLYQQQANSIFDDPRVRKSEAKKQAKVFHDEAIALFTKSIETDPNNAWAYFRRAWSYKAIGMYPESGADFEVAKKLRWNDPNFSVDYKRIARCAYMEIESEPDLQFKFPCLLPQPSESVL